MDLVERVMLDALAQRVGPEQAPEVLRRSMVGTPVPPPGGDAQDLTEYLHAHVKPTLRRHLGLAETRRVVIAAEALLAPLRRDGLLATRSTGFRAPYVLLSDVPNTLEGVIEMRRVTSLFDALIEADALPEATLIVDAAHTSVSLSSLALAAAELPGAMQMVIVAATDEQRAEFETVARRAATFLPRYLPLDLRPLEPLAHAA